MIDDLENEIVKINEILINLHSHYDKLDKDIPDNMVENTIDIEMIN